MPVIGGPQPPVTGIGTPQVILYSALNNAYPPRPAGLAAGLAIWRGPVEPTNATAGGAGAVDGDIWEDPS